MDEHADALPGGVTIEPSSGGVFEIFLGEKLLYSKKQQGRFPEPGEIVHLLTHELNLRIPQG